MKSLMLFLASVYADCGDQCSASTHLDLKTVKMRVKHEGLSFLTITLPNFGKEFERALDLGYVENTMFASFSRHRGLPRFLGGFLSQVFDAGTGRLLADPSIDAIRAVRQITLLHGKMRAICSTSRERAAFTGYASLDQKVGYYDDELRSRVAETPEFLLRGVFPRYGTGDSDRAKEYIQKIAPTLFTTVAKLLWRDPLGEAANRFFADGVTPKHGPGSTADGLKGNLKYRQRVWTSRLDTSFPFGEYAFPNWRSFLEASGLTYLDPGNELPSKVISVPKTMKTPRLIAVEPTCMQYIQQGLARLLTESFRDHKSLWKMIGFDDQTPNQRMALKASFDGSYATLDLSEASDRVSMWHVEQVLSGYPSLWEAILACRSSKASVPGVGTIVLSKFASMGSALCFPMEAVVFLTAVFVGISIELNRPLSVDDISSFSSQVRVFGDDIIVPQRFALSVVMTLEVLGFKVNMSKSFWTGKFRESCGKEYYAGRDVNIVKVREQLPSQRENTKEIISAVSMRNQFFMAGRVRTVEFLDNLIERIIPFPEVAESSPILGKYTWGPIGSEGTNHNLQQPFVKGVVVVPLRRRREIDGWDALMKWFLMANERKLAEGETPWYLSNQISVDKVTGLPSVDKDHLTYSGRPAALTLKVVRRRPY